MEALNFDFYVTNFKGVTVPDNDTFERLLIEAKAFVDSLILSREMLEFDVVNNRYCNAICAVADCIYRQEVTQSGIKASESVGNHSVSYVTKTANDITAERKQKALVYLQGTGLLTRAVM